MIGKNIRDVPKIWHLLQHAEALAILPMLWIQQTIFSNIDTCTNYNCQWKI